MPHADRGTGRRMSSSEYQINKPAGEFIFHEGEVADCAYVIEQGRIEIAVNRDDDSVVLGELGPGEILGEMAVMDQFCRTASARVTEDCLLTVVTPRQIQQRIEASDPIVRALLSVLLTRYRSGLSLDGGGETEDGSAPDAHAGGIEKIRFENELRRALEEGEIKVVYQPIRCLRRGSVSGFEALVRWDHPAEGTIPAERLVALAEETDLIIPLSLYVFEAAVADFTAFRSAAPPGLFVSVNVSPKHTLDSEFLNRAWDICSGADCKPGDIMLELTESIMVDIEQLSSWVRTAKAMGFRISVDDFGTGYASLEYLTRLEPHTVKIDQDFIRPIVDDWRHRSVMRRVLDMAGDLGVLVIAEGVETPGIVSLLTEMDCDMAQGYGVGRPLAPARVGDYLAANLLL